MQAPSHIKLQNTIAVSSIHLTLSPAQPLSRFSLSPTQALLRSPLFNLYPSPSFFCSVSYSVSLFLSVVSSPIISVCPQCDAVAVLEKEHDYREEHFDFLQSHIRRFCLNCILQYFLPILLLTLSLLFSLREQFFLQLWLALNTFIMSRQSYLFIEDEIKVINPRI